MFLPVALPMPAAQAAPAAPTFHEVRLFFHDRETMSTAPFQTTSTSTPKQDWLGDREGPELPADLTLSKAHGFLIVLPERTSQPGNVTTWVEIAAVGRLGERLVLANATFVTPRNDVGEEERQTGDIVVDNSFAGGMGDLVALAVDQAVDVVEPLAQTPDGGAVVDQTVCTHARPGCGSYHGDPGTGAVHPCRSHRPIGNLPAELTWSVVHLADEEARQATGRGVCDPASEDVQAAWDEAEAPLPPVDVPDVWVPDIPSEVRAPDVATYPMPTVATSEENWTVLSLALDAPSSLPQDETSVRIPSGFRLMLTADEFVEAPRGRGLTSIFLSGHPETPAALVFRSSTPGSFGMLTGGTPVSTGLHADAVPSGAAFVDHRLELPDLRVINVSKLQGVGSVRAWDENGVAIPASEWGSYVFPAGASRSVLVRYVLGTGSNDRQYVLRIQDATSAPLPTLTSGESVGSTLGPGTETFEVAFFAWQAQRFMLRLTEPSDSSYALRLQTPAWDTTESNDPTTLTARAAKTGLQRAVVARDHGSGAFTLTLDLDPRGNLSAAPRFEVVHPARSAKVYPHGAGVDALVSDLAGSEAWHVNEAGATYLGDDVAGPLLRTATGESVAGWGTQLAWDVFGASPRGLSAYPNSYAFGADGALYVLSAVPHEIIRILPSREETRMPGVQGEFIAAPDGRLLLRPREGATLVVDFANSTLVQAPPHEQGVFAFDAEGAAYRILNGTLIERATSDGDTRIVSVAPPLREITSVAVTGGSLWAGMRAPRVPDHPEYPTGVARVPLDVAGFAGFEPPFVPALGPNLRIADAWDVNEGVAIDLERPAIERHTLRVAIANTGDAPAYLFRVLVEQQCVGCPYWSDSVPVLAAGETRVLEFAWESSLDSPHVGDQQFVIRVDVDFEVAETDEADNRGQASSFVLAGGNGAACEAAWGSPDGPCSVARV